MKLLITTYTLLYFITSSVSWGVTMKDLVNENGIYYSKSSDIPLTGNVTLKTCESNEPHCKELVNLKNGKKDGSLWKEITGEFKHGIRISNNPLNLTILFCLIHLEN